MMRCSCWTLPSFLLFLSCYTLHFPTACSLLPPNQLSCRFPQQHQQRQRWRQQLLPAALLSTPRLTVISQEQYSSSNRFPTIRAQKEHHGDNVDDEGCGNLLEPRVKMIQTPHSGRHFLPSHPAYRKSFWRRWHWKGTRRRFMEGWYYRLTLVEEKVSFAFIMSIEDPGVSPPSDLRLACIQVIGPDDGYLVQADKDDTKFWAEKGQQALGCNFEYFQEQDATKHAKERTTVMTQHKWKNNVKSGFQVLPNHLLGRVDGHDGTQGGVLKGQGVPGWCEFDIQLDPICGWGGRIDGSATSTSTSTPSAKQKSTGGWLSRFDVFEPHWQVTMADARASGTVIWNNTKYAFVNEPFYAEKNWGAALPSKWYWTQCNSFDGYDQLSVTAGGGIRKVPFGGQESLGTVSVHYNGTFYEAVPWTGTMAWNVSTWGYWKLQGICTTGTRPFECEVIYQCNPETTPGLVFRAPTPDQGLVYFCRDTFEADTTLTLWELELDPSTKQYVRKNGAPLIDRAKSSQGGAEIGGGPWWDSWIATSQLKKIIRRLLAIPYKARMTQARIRKKFSRRR